MKFAKELERECVPEWRAKYLNYKAGKKYVKAVSTAINRAHTSPRGAIGKGDPSPDAATPFFPSPHTPHQRDVETGIDSSENQGTPRSQREPPSGQVEHSSLTRSPGNGGNYGSFNFTPASRARATSTTGSRNPFELPAPAMRVPSNGGEHPPRKYSTTGQESLNRVALQRSASMAPTIQTRGTPVAFSRPSPSSYQQSPGRLRRLFSTGPTLTRTDSVKYELGMQALDTVRQREKEFFDFLDGELEKVETFYQEKEEQAGIRLAALRQQLHEMKDRRTQELDKARQHKEQENGNASNSSAKASSHDYPQGFLGPIKSKLFRPGPNSKALSTMPMTPVVGASGYNPSRDYARRRQSDDVPYKSAKRKLKLALEEFYRSLELLKAYTLLNRTAFRKLNKKHDKAVNARPAYRYMNEKVNKAWFVKSDLVENYIRDVEDLYARYFEGNNHKLAAGKLRRLIRRPRDESATTFHSGLFIGVGGVFTVQGLIFGAQLLFDTDPDVREQTVYLMQLYGGYFIMLLLFFLFCIDCSIWTSNKINYQFIFEFDPRHQLDWRQLSNFPSFFLMLFGLIFWLNFTRYGSSDMYLYYPIFLIAISLVIILLPAPILWHKSRRWFAYSHWRLLLAGLYPVEFRDFFLGDMYCSLTYATCNIELFFCLYANEWENPVQCNSNHSRLLGFFSALPPIWRALQCIRRYYDTRNVFPHLVNCGKYFMTILAAMTLSLYRIEGSKANFGLFVTFATLNGIYTSIWDLLMDFSLLQPDARHRFLRDLLGLKRQWPYYTIMIIDPILRFAWIFYAIFTYDRQHSTIVAFLVSVAEVLRRGMWALIRVENEHCFNVAAYKASRDLPLPYRLDNESLSEQGSTTDESRPKSRKDSSAAVATAVDASAGGSSARGREEGSSAVAAAAAAQTTPVLEAGGLRRRRSELPGARSIRGIMAEAHRQDFEKKRRPPPHESGAVDEDDDEDDDDDDDDHGPDIHGSDDEDDDDDDERMAARRTETLVREQEG